MKVLFDGPPGELQGCMSGAIRLFSSGVRSEAFAMQGGHCFFAHEYRKDRVVDGVLHKRHSDPWGRAP